uniref:SH2 domain-containing protein n=1 Tax=Stegastes partitus TaxID=144197 RepID=A0A3B5AS20_9TELE
MRLIYLQKDIPKNLQLLPGQMMQLKETLSQERKRNPKLCRGPTLPPRPMFLKSLDSNNDSTSPPKDKCFFDVTRQEAEQMLKANPEYGSIILRPSTLTNNYALTLRQPTPRSDHSSKTVTKMITPCLPSLQVTASSLNDVLKYFLEKTEHRLHPYVTSQAYDTRIGENAAHRESKA